MNGGAAVFAILVTLYFWWENTKGIPESSEKALRIMYVTTAMMVLMVSWCCYATKEKLVEQPFNNQKERKQTVVPSTGSRAGMKVSGQFGDIEATGTVNI
jgi:hypothetical protein